MPDTTPSTPDLGAASQSARAGDGNALTAEQVEKLAAAHGVTFRRVYRPGNKIWADVSEGLVGLDTLTRIVGDALAAAPAVSATAAIPDDEISNPYRLSRGAARIWLNGFRAGERAHGIQAPATAEGSQP